MAPCGTGWTQNAHVLDSAFQEPTVKGDIFKNKNKQQQNNKTKNGVREPKFFLEKGLQFGGSMAWAS